MTDTTKLFNDTMELLADIIIPEQYKCVSMCENSIECDKLKRLADLIINARRIENPVPCFRLFDVVVLPFKDIKFNFSKTNNSFYVYYSHGVIDKLTYPEDVFKYINASIHLKLKEKYDSRTITYIILDVMIYCIINKIEINILSLIDVDLNLKEKEKYNNNNWVDTKNNFIEVMPDGYMKDVMLKAIEQERICQKIPHTYSIVDIVNSLKL